ncbi:hypothetical protein [Gehongia tenuis]|uniref:Uncharacterized protein n=1 Tax=Gehongia tenuis TaxID=2763655 RepID=A0A926HQI0_9FIRM|nr:hypothetical protein [Gehongia tenuis]MBC8532233.1 hypothetical protein [Gehongia tenuis]
MNEDWTDELSEWNPALGVPRLSKLGMDDPPREESWDVEDIVRSLEHPPLPDAPVCESAPRQEDIPAPSLGKAWGAEAVAAALVPLASLHEIALPAWQYDYDKYLDFPSTTRLARNRKKRGFWWRLFHH